jgi:hypothetical protein
MVEFERHFVAQGNGIAGKRRRMPKIRGKSASVTGSRTRLREQNAEGPRH